MRRNIFYTSNGGSGSGIDSDRNAFLWNPNDRGASRIYADDARPSSHSLGKTYATRLIAANDIFVNPDVSAATDYGLNADFTPKAGSRVVGLGRPRRPSAVTLGRPFTACEQPARPAS